MRFGRPNSNKENIRKRVSGANRRILGRAYLQLQDVDHLTKVPSEQVTSRNVRDGVHDSILIR